MLNRTVACLRDGHRHRPATFSNTRALQLLKESQHGHVFDSRATELFRCSPPRGNLWKIDFAAEALCAFCDRACLDFLDPD